MLGSSQVPAFFFVLAAGEGSWEDVAVFFCRRCFLEDLRTMVESSLGVGSSWTVAVNVSITADVVSAGKVQVFFEADVRWRAVGC